MMQQPIQSNVLLAARRFYKRDGTTVLSLVYTKTGARLEEDEEVLNKSAVYLGDYLQISRDGSYSKLPPVGGFEVKVTKNVAYVRRVPAKLVHGTGMVLFESEYFGRSKCNLMLFNIKMGDYLIDISLLEEPIKMMNGAELHFDATNALPILSGPPPQVSPPPVPPRHQLFGNGFAVPANERGFGGNLNQRPVDPIAHLTPQFDAKLNLFEPIQPPVPRKEETSVELPDASFFAVRPLHNMSPTSSISSTFLPAPPRPSTAAAQRYHSPTFSPPTPTPRINTPLVQQPLSPPNHPAQVPTKFLFAARRWQRPDGKPFLVLIEPKSGENFLEEESVLNANQIVLGDWVRARVQGIAGHKTLHSFTKSEHTAKLDVKPEGDVAYVANIRCTLVDEKEGHQVFQCSLFANALSKQRLAPGKYFARISLLSEPHRLPDGTVLYFEGTNARPIVKMYPKNPMPKVNGAGFPVAAAEKKVVVGAGFGEAAKNQVINGVGFKPKPTQLVKARAVVMSFTERDGVRTHYLWILDKQAEGRLMQKNCKLQIGHFFEGTFKENANGKWACQTYEKGLEMLIEGGLDNDGFIFFKVKIEKYTAATGNMKYAEANAKYIGKILDIESKLSDNCVGKKVKIQRKGVAKADYIWAVIEVL